jgi:hypothetical protein
MLNSVKKGWQMRDGGFSLTLCYGENLLSSCPFPVKLDIQAK